MDKHTRAIQADAMSIIAAFVFFVDSFIVGSHIVKNGLAWEGLIRAVFIMFVSGAIAYLFSVRSRIIETSATYDVINMLSKEQKDNE